MREKNNQDAKENERYISLESKDKRNTMNFEEKSQKEFFVDNVEIDERRHDE